MELTIFHLINQVGTLQTDNFNLQQVAQQVTITDNVPNNSLEQVSSDVTKPALWDSGSWGQNSATFAYLNNDAHTGTHSVQTQITSYTSGDAKWFYQTQVTTPNSKWTFTDYYKSNIQSRVVVEITNSDKTLSYIELKSAPAASAWTKYTDNFTTTSNAQSLSVFHLISSVGTLTTDDYSVTPYVPTGFNRALVSLTFDDSWASQHDTALPLLQSHNFPATFYIITGFLNDTTDGYMTTQMVIDLKNDGEEITSHTIDHPHLTTLSDADLDSELKNSQIFMQTNFGVSSSDFAAPYGEVDDRVTSAIKTYYSSERGVIDGYNYKDTFDAYNLKVQNVLLTTTPADVQGWLNEAAQTKAWLILVFHQVDHGGDPYGTIPELFTSEINNVAASNLPVVTINQGLNEVLPQINN